MIFVLKHNVVVEPSIFFNSCGSDALYGNWWAEVRQEKASKKQVNHEGS